MNVTKTSFDELYQYIDEGALFLEKQKDITYLDAIAEIGTHLFGDKTQKMELTDQLNQQLAAIDVDVLDREVVRKAFQMSVLKGMKGATQPHHSMTPDAVSLFASYIINKITGQHDKNQAIKLLDLAVGTGNLLTTILNHSPLKLEASGFEADETLLHIAYANANLQQHQLELYHQDSLQMSLNKSDLVVTDLPIGYYPKDEIASTYSLKAVEGHAYIHHLMIEQGIRSLTPGGYALYLVPNFLFESDQADQLHAFLKDETVILSLLQLPKTMFHAEQQGKSFLLLQKKGEKTIVPRHALLAELPSFDKKEALADMMERINDWFAQELRL
ncbi:class I SAM-dependent methyltransferase [Alkalicoccobacillus porphyridii]|uniref:Class I SAM-dependent methyltransferase n=1 Tax=Alkalicoccobacillus porphyridii TaxID=2597270 RepID=A0A554A336_9BACI|nr:class I SAM-dependent methyltransferase [Alkalicoccobacillus porphyridii]TSB48056.1 class I SAM-dependent methyltransferase [Alkalicoccobacillus porphyridii]